MVTRRDKAEQKAIRGNGVNGGCTRGHLTRIQPRLELVEVRCFQEVKRMCLK